MGATTAQPPRLPVRLVAEMLAIIPPGSDQLAVGTQVEGIDLAGG